MLLSFLSSIYCLGRKKSFRFAISSWETVYDIVKASTFISTKIIPYIPMVSAASVRISLLKGVAIA